jgi:hypothetical protein
MQLLKFKQRFEIIVIDLRQNNNKSKSFLSSFFRKKFFLYNPNIKPICIISFSFFSSRDAATEIEHLRKQRKDLTRQKTEEEHDGKLIHSVKLFFHQFCGFSCKTFTSSWRIKKKTNWIRGQSWTSCSSNATTTCSDNYPTKRRLKSKISFEILSYFFY